MTKLIERRFYGTISEQYKLVRYVYPDFNVFQGLIAEIINKYGETIKDNEISILDIGCGYGATTEIIKRKNPSYNVVAIDNEPIMIRQAKEYLNNWMTGGKLEIVEADALDYINKLDSEQIDVIASDLTIHNFNNPYREKLLGEIYRVLKPNGVFINSDKYAKPGLRRLYDFLFELIIFIKVFLKYKKYKTLIDWTIHHIKDQFPSRIMKESDFTQYLKSIGFLKIEFLYRGKIISVLKATKNS